MFKNFIRHPIVRRSANPRKLSAFKYLNDIKISPKFIPLFLSRCQVTADKTKGCLVQRKSYRYTTLQSENTLQLQIKRNILDMYFSM